MSVPLIDLTRQNQPLEAEFVDVFVKILRSGAYILGPENTAFEEQLAHFCEALGALSISSGTDAILVSLMALGIQPGDEVLCPTYTFFATAGCIARLGAVPIFVDACPLSFNIDIEDAKRKITARTKAIIPVHLFGQAADMEGVMALAQAHNLFVVEDAAQALGARFKGQSVGTFGHFGTFSFFPTKNLGCMGDGGALIAQQADLLDRAKLLRNHGAHPKYFHQQIGGNFRLDTVQSALLYIKLKHYGAYTKGRQDNALYYTQAFSEIPGVYLNDCLDIALNPEKYGAQILLPSILEYREHIWNQYTIRVIGAGRRDALKSYLSSVGIGSETYYPCTMDAQACFADLNQSHTIHIAHQLSQEALSLPIMAELTPAERDEVVSAIQTFLKQS